MPQFTMASVNLSGIITVKNGVALINHQVEVSVRGYEVLPLGEEITYETRSTRITISNGQKTGSYSIPNVDLLSQFAFFPRYYDIYFSCLTCESIFGLTGFGDKDTGLAVNLPSRLNSTLDNGVRMSGRVSLPESIEANENLAVKLEIIATYVSQYGTNISMVKVFGPSIVIPKGSNSITYSLRGLYMDYIAGKTYFVKATCEKCIKGKKDWTRKLTYTGGNYSNIDFLLKPNPTIAPVLNLLLN